MKPNEQLLWFNEARSIRYFFHGQFRHLIALLILIPVTWAFAAPVMGDHSWMGIQDTAWFWLAVSLSVLHQIIVWIVFRSQLGWAALTKAFGRLDLYIWGLLFLPLLAARPVLLLGLAYATEDSLMLSPIAATVLALFLLIPALYTLWSVIAYFGLVRAMGADHFRISYRSKPLVDQGAFRYSPNAMYAFAFFILWSIALLTSSQAALSVALFEHAYVWVHYYCTEKPDMDIIYGLKK